MILYVSLLFICRFMYGNTPRCKSSPHSQDTPQGKCFFDLISCFTSYTILHQTPHTILIRRTSF
ncbi:hypothetical protein EON63_11135 [archaeon]|nr:MAG: hypothetical protein EON63_11135 [archaeon]